MKQTSTILACGLLFSLLSAAGVACNTTQCYTSTSYTSSLEVSHSLSWVQCERSGMFSIAAYSAIPVAMLAMATAAPSAGGAQGQRSKHKHRQTALKSGRQYARVKAEGEEGGDEDDPDKRWQGFKRAHELDALHMNLLEGLYGNFISKRGRFIKKQARE
jgi:hypothetical protein